MDLKIVEEALEKLVVIGHNYEKCSAMQSSSLPCDCGYQRATKALTALRSGELVVLPGWQPIETAPRDGTEILVVTSYGLRATLKWVGNESEGGWRRVLGCRRCDAMGLGSLTHWVPLPEGPAITGQDGE